MHLEKCSVDQPAMLNRRPTQIAAVVPLRRLYIHWHVSRLHVRRDVIIRDRLLNDNGISHFSGTHLDTFRAKATQWGGGGRSSGIGEHSNIGRSRQH
jgi:hypothetical protein